MWKVRDGAQSSRTALLVKFQFPILPFPMLASVRFRQLLWTPASAYLVQLRQHDMWAGGAEARFPDPILANISVFSAVLSNLAHASFRQLPWTSVSIYFVQFKQRDIWEGAGSQSPWATF